ncbi:MAG: GPW/gp25 family protein, partial [Candidatus Solibacter sp.]|nr:GPW/gp25 family protein [Candidatus Solibacter sp.]
RLDAVGAATCTRSQHVRQLIEKVLFTIPPERVFRPDFGAGVLALVFEPNASLLSEIVCKRLTSSLAEALRGEVDPKTLRVSVAPDPDQQERLVVTIEYQLAALGKAERLTFPLQGGASG